MLTSPTRQPSALFEPSWETARRTLLLRDIVRQNHATKVHSVLLGATISKFHLHNVWAGNEAPPPLVQEGSASGRQGLVGDLRN